MSREHPNDLSDESLAVDDPETEAALGRQSEDTQLTLEEVQQLYTEKRENVQQKCNLDMEERQVRIHALHMVLGGIHSFPPAKKWSTSA